MPDHLVELRRAIRTLLRQPGSSVLAVVALALGIGFSTAMFTIVRGTFFPRLPFPGSGRLMRVERRSLKEERVLPEELLVWQAGSRAFKPLAGWIEAGATLSGDGRQAEDYRGAYVSAELFEAVGVWPVLGRTFTAAEEQAQAPSAVILGHRLWRQRYQGDPRVVGQTVRIGGDPARIIGVMPAGFRFPRDEDYWLPLGPILPAVGRNQLRLDVFGRLRDGASREQAAAELDALAAHIPRESTPGTETRVTLVSPFGASYTASARRPLLLLTGAACAVLLVGCANVTHLLLARGALRWRDLAVRAAFGAGRRALVSPVLSEAFVLAAVGGLAGVAVAMGGIGLYNATGGLVRSFWVDIRLDGAALSFVVALVGVVTLACGALPALRVGGADPSQVLKDRQSGLTSRGLGPWSRLLVVAQVTLSCALLVGASQLIESVRRLYRQDFGAEPERVWTALVAVDPERFPTPESWLRFYDELGRELSAIPGAGPAAWATRLPPLATPLTPVEIEGSSLNPANLPSVRWSVVSPGFFAALGRPVLAGRDFLEADRQGSVPTVLVNRSFARRFFPAVDPVGRRLRLAGSGGPWATIVGVVPDLYLGWDEAGERLGTDHPQGLYFPLAQRPRPGMYLLQRTAVPPAVLEKAAREALAKLAPNVALSHSRTLVDVLDEVSADNRMMRTLFATFGAAALTLAGIGLYGVLSFFAGQRRKEIAIRIAVGAGRWHVMRLILREGGVQAGLGLILGLSLAAAGSRLLRAWLYDLEPGNVLLFLPGATALIAIAAGTCLALAWRAARLDPARCLRAE
ncbi:MAG TPA: ABC transporter permease [Thermoanaerobaculia bacterium]|jgi:predicted permease|nr:ABC transporter permease [Thermoanaerobaculia bacterium]